ncbi:hypothetical protein, partial [Klebsiella pneumoniae]
PIGRREVLKLGGAGAACALLPGAMAAPAIGRAIIDVHMHAYPATMQLPAPVTNPISGFKSPIRTGTDHLAACIAEMKKHNVVKGVV